MNAKRSTTNHLTSAIFILGVALALPNSMTAQEQADEQIFTIVENMPTYKGCETYQYEEAQRDCTTEKIIDYLSENMTYPEEAKSKGIEGRVFISYIVDREGKVADVEVLRGIPNGDLLNEEAVRVIEEMPDFNPGTQRGKAVAVRYNIPLNFTMNKEIDRTME